MTDTFRDVRASVDERVHDLLGRMTLVEKVRQLGGMSVLGQREGGTITLEAVCRCLADGIGHIGRPMGAAADPHAGAELTMGAQRFLVERTRLGIPAIMHDEALSGFQAPGFTIFPQAIGLAATFDPALVSEMTDLIRRQMRAAGVHQALSPVLDVGRDPRWGRIEETYGEDRLLCALMALAFVQGLQGDDLATGIAATLKHFAGYSVTEGGRNWAPTHAGWREMRELFLFPFEVAVRDGRAASVMNSYSQIDGVPAHVSRELLTDILRAEWGFEGAVVSDYYSMQLLIREHGVARDRRDAAVQSVRAGLDIELPDALSYADPLVEAVEAGEVGEDEVDVLVARVLALKVRLGLFEQPYGDPPSLGALLDPPAGRALARRLAEESIVLLRNDGILPLAPAVRSVAVIGPNAARERGLLGDYTWTNMSESVARLAGGTIPLVGAGEGAVWDPVPVVTVLDGIRARAGDGFAVRYAPGCTVEGDDTSGFDEAVTLARESDVAVVVLGDQAGILAQGTVGEGRDGATLALPGVQEELLRAVAATGTPVVLVLANGRPFVLTGIADQVAALVEAWFPGEEGGHAIAGVLFGDVNPSGRLPVTLPGAVGHVPCCYDHHRYGWHDYTDSTLAPAFAFGHGLSYTTFEYGELAITPAAIPADGEVTISCTVRNTGERAGTEVVQVYVRDVVASTTRPVMELKAFARVVLGAGEAATAHATLPADLLGLYDRDMRHVVEPGTFEVMVGASSADIRCRGELTITGDPLVLDGDWRRLPRVAVTPAGARGAV